jgi:predicted ester cyclase
VTDPKQIVRRWVGEAINEGRFENLDELCTPEAAERSRDWITPFRRAFPDVQMNEIELLAEGDRLAGRFTCSATHSGTWGPFPATGRRFENVDEVYFFRIAGGRLADWWGLEDNAARLRQLGLGR